MNDGAVIPKDGLIITSDSRALITTTASQITVRWLHSLEYVSRGVFKWVVVWFRWN